MNIFRFLEWPMYKDAKKLNQTVSKICRGFSFEVKKVYQSQFQRAALSVSLNIAEGAGRYSDTEMCRHFDISLGSLAEAVACADNIKDERVISKEQFDDILKQAQNIERQIQGMKNDIYNNPRTYKRNVKVRTIS